MNIKVFILGLLISFSTIFIVGKFIVSAQDPCSSVVNTCPTPCAGGSQNTNCYIPNFDCLSQRVLDPMIICCISKCANEQISGSELEQLRVFYRTFNFFGTKVNINTDSLVGWLTLGIQAFLAVVSIIALVKGIKAGVIDVPKGEELDKVKRDITNTIMGFILAWGAIFIIQIILSVLGIPGLNELVIIGDPPNSGQQSTIVIK